MIVLEYGRLVSERLKCERCGTKFEYDITDVAALPPRTIQFGRRATDTEIDEYEKRIKAEPAGCVECPMCHLKHTISFEKFEKLDKRNFREESYNE